MSWLPGDASEKNLAELDDLDRSRAVSPASVLVLGYLILQLARV